MSNEQLKHIFDDSTCLTKKQMISYVSGRMTNEEAHAVEVHLNSCQLCSDAVDGMLEKQAKALKELPTLNADFLQSHLSSTIKQINLSAASQQANIKKNKVQNLWRPVSLAAGLLLLVVSIWYYRMLQDDSVKPQIAQELPPAQVEAAASSPSQPIAMNEAPKESSDVVQHVSEPAAVKAVTAKDAMMDNAKAMAPAFAEKKENTKQPEDVVAKADKAPLTAQDERKTITSDEIEKMPTSSTVNAATINASNYSQKALGNSYNADAAPAMTPTTQRKGSAETITIDKLEQADKLYEAQQYNDALNIYSREMQATETNENKSRIQKASIGAARCYIALGKVAKAKEILNSVIDAGGKYKREAKRLLREIE